MFLFFLGLIVGIAVTLAFAFREQRLRYPQLAHYHQKCVQFEEILKSGAIKFAEVRVVTPTSIAFGYRNKGWEAEFHDLDKEPDLFNALKEDVLKAHRENKVVQTDKVCLERTTPRHTHISYVAVPAENGTVMICGWNVDTVVKLAKTEADDDLAQSVAFLREGLMSRKGGMIEAPVRLSHLK